MSKLITVNYNQKPCYNIVIENDFSNLGQSTNDSVFTFSIFLTSSMSIAHPLQNVSVSASNFFYFIKSTTFPVCMSIITPPFNKIK